MSGPVQSYLRNQVAPGIGREPKISKLAAALAAYAPAAMRRSQLAAALQAPQSTQVAKTAPPSLPDASRHVWRKAARVSPGIQSSLESFSAAASEQPMEILHTKNPTWGFFSTFSHHTADPVVAWAAASEAIAKATGCQVEAVRLFLDSKNGRYFGYNVVMSANIALDAAVNDTVAQWMRWKVVSGPPYLTDVVSHCEADTGEGWVRRVQPFV
jgi:hypothetical protein